MSPPVGYLIVYADDATDMVIPDDESIPRVLYRSLAEARTAAVEWMETFTARRMALYGEAYPYDNTTLEAEVDSKGRGVVGWVSYDDEDGRTTYTIQIVAMSYA